MPPRRWVHVLCCVLVAAGLCVAARARAAVDGETATATDERLLSGVPLGGLGTGKVELFTDGTLGNLTTNNNWEAPVAELPGSFFAVRAAEDDSPGVGRVLALRSPYRLPVVSGVRAQGQFPGAQLRYAEDALPVEVSLAATGYLIPHNPAESALPIAAFTFTVTNPGRKGVTATVAFSWENTVGAGGNSRGAWDDRSGNTQVETSTEGRTGLLFKGPGEGEGPRRASQGTYAVLGEAEGGRVATLRNWNAAGDGQDFWAFVTGTPRPAAPPSAATAARDRPAGAVSVLVRLAPGESREVHFTLAWHFPHLVTADGEQHGRAADERFADAWAAALYAAQYRETLASGTAEWRDLILAASLPGWLKHQVLNDLYPLTANSIYTRAGRFTMLEALSERDGALGALDWWPAARGPLAVLFPALHRAELARFAARQSEAGEIPRQLGNLVDGFDRETSPRGDGNRPDTAAAFVLEMYRVYRGTGDLEALRAGFPAAQRALEWLRTRDSDGDLLPEGPTMWEYRRLGGTFAYTGTLYLAALRAAEAMARALGDRRAEDGYREQFRLARLNLMSELWNGRYLATQLDPESGQRMGTLFAGALAGQVLCGQLGLPPVLEPPVAETALRSLLDLLPSAAPFTPPNEVTMNGTPAPGVEDISWPGALLAYVAAPAIAGGRPEVGLALARRIREAQFEATRSPWDLTLQYHPRTAQRVGPRSHLAALSSWRVLEALTGAVPDEPGGRLVVTPRVPTSWEGLRAPIFTPRYWAWMEYARSPHSAAVNLRLRLLKKFDDRPVMLTGLTVPAPPGARLEDLSLLITGPGGEVESRAELQGDLVAFVFKLPYEWRLGEVLEATVVPAEANTLLLTLGPGNAARMRSLGSVVTAREVSREQQVRFTLINPARERQVVNIRFANPRERNFEVWLNGQQLGRFTPDTPDERLTLVVPASSVPYERITALRAVLTRLDAAAEQGRAAGHGEALAAPVEGVRAAVMAAIKADEEARSTAVVLHPLGSRALGTRLLGARLFRNRLKEPPPAVQAADPEPAVAAAEAAVAAVTTRLSEQVPDVVARSILQRALHPVEVTVTALDALQPGGTARLQLTIANNGATPVRAAWHAEYPAGWEGPVAAPRVSVAPGEAESTVFSLRLPQNLESRRYRLEGHAILSAHHGSWAIPTATVLGNGAIRGWSLIGAWNAAAGVDEALPPDSALDAAASYDGRRWQQVLLQGPRLDLAARFPDAPRGVAYAAVRVNAAAESEVVLEVATEGGLLVRLNGQAVYARAASGAEAQRIPLRLRAGANTLVLKVARTAPAWGLTAELVTAAGETPSGVRVEPALSLPAR